jgi:hypothetical protein
MSAYILLFGVAEASSVQTKRGHTNSKEVADVMTVNIEQRATRRHNGRTEAEPARAVSSSFLKQLRFFSAHKTLREMSVSTANKTEKMGHAERNTNGDTNGDTIPDYVIVQGIRYEPVTEQRKPYISSKGSKLLHPGTWPYLLRFRRRSR